jgi:hypothetical protein
MRVGKPHLPHDGPVAKYPQRVGGSAAEQGGTGHDQAVVHHGPEGEGGVRASHWT